MSLKVHFIKKIYGISDLGFYKPKLYFRNIVQSRIVKSVVFSFPSEPQILRFFPKYKFSNKKWRERQIGLESTLYESSDQSDLSKILKNTSKEKYLEESC